MSAEARNIQQAIVNAHKAGDVQAAERLGQVYNSKYGKQPKAKDGAFEGFGDAFKRGIDQPLENFGTTAKVLGAENLGQSLQDAVEAPPGQSASSQFMHADKDGSFAYRYLPKAAVEQAGQFAGSLISRAGGAAAGGVVAGPPGAVAGGIAGPMFFEAIQQLGPIALERAKNNGRTEPTREDFIYAAGTSMGVGALNAIAPGASGKVKRMLLEGVTEGTQSVGEQTGSTINTQKGLEVDPRQALAEGIIGGSSAGLVDTSISTVSAATNLVRGSGKKKDSEMSDADSEAQASLAQRLSNIATANNYDLKDIDRTSTKGARETVDKAHVQYTEELKQLFKDLKDRVKVTDADSLAEVQNKILAEAAYREGRNKTKNTVGAEEMAALDKLAGDTYEGQQAMSLLRQMNQLTEMHNDGYKGGASRVTDQFAPFGLGGEGYDSSRANAEQVLRPLITGGLASATGGASLLPQAAAYGTGRMIDKITGNRSKVKSFVSDNVGNEGIKVGSHPNPESLRERRREEAQAAQEAEIAAQAAAEQRAAEKRESNLKSVRNNDPANPGSPQGIVELGTALDRNGVAQVLRIMKGNPNTTAYERKMIEDYETSVATGGYIDYDIVRKINGIVDNNPQLKPLMGNRVRNQGAVTEAAQQQFSQQDANYQRGIENNKAFAQQLQDALAQDKSVLPIHKAHLGEALNQMQLDLGAAPVKRLKAIEDRLAEKGVPTEAAAKYFGPYVERVVAQQEAKADRDATAAALDEDPVNDARIVPVPRGNDRMQQIFGVNEPGEGGNYIDLDSKEDLTGNTYTGGVVKIIDGKPLLETNDAPAAPATKESGNKVKVNLFKQKAGWKWIDYDGPETIVSTHQGSKHHYSLSSDFETPVTLQTYPKQPSEPRLRPTSQGKVVLGNKIGSISVRGKVHPVYDQVTIVDKRDQEDPVNDSRGIGRISPAMPTGAKPIFDHGVDKRPVSLELINQDPTLPGRIVAKMRPYIPLQNAPEDEQSFLEQTVEFMKDNLIALYGSVSPEYRERSKLWYVGANKLSQNVADKYGQSLEAVAGVMSALSPGLDWYVNYDIGVRLLDIHKNHQDTVFGDAEYKAAMKFVNSIKPTTPKKKVNKKRHKDYVNGIRGKTLKELDFFEQAYFVRFYDVANATERGHRIITPEGDLGDFVLNKDGTKKDAVFSDLPPIAISMAILSDPSPDNISSQLGRGHKRRNFYNNIYAPNNDQGDVTIDTHAVAASLFLPLSQKSIEVVQNFGTPDSTNVGSYGTYGVYAEAYRRAAAQVGILPREMQSITWEAVRGLFPATWKQQKKNVDSIRNVWDDYKNGKLSLEQARKTVYEKAGNIRSAQWEDERPSFGIDEKQGDQTDSRSLPRTSVPGRNELGSESDAPGRVLQPAQEVEGPVLATEDPVNNSASIGSIVSSYLEPTPAEIKRKLPEAEDLVQFTIGKKGSDYEPGIRNLADINRLASLLDISINVVNAKGTVRGVISRDSLGNYKNKNRGTEGAINIRSADIIGDTQYAKTLLHEVLHGYEGQTLDGEMRDGYVSASPHPRGSKARNAETHRAGSFRHHMHHVLKLAKDGMEQYMIDITNNEPEENISEIVKNLPSFEDARKIRSELDAIQNNQTPMRFPGFYPGTVNTNLVVRETYEPRIEEDARKLAKMDLENNPNLDYEATVTKHKNLGLYRFSKEIRDYTRYIKDTAEINVDALQLYVSDPKMMKEVAPTAAAYIRKVFNKANMPIKFYSSPLVTVLAILLAGLAKGMGGEEEEQQPGALSMQPGPLTT